MFNPNRIDRPWAFDEMATELGDVPFDAMPETFSESVAEPIALSERVGATGGTAVLVSRAFSAASSEQGEYAGAVLSDYPFTFAAWVKPASVGTPGVIFAIATSGSSNNYFRVDISGTGAVRMRARDGSSVSDAITTTTMSVGAWYFVAAVFDTATSRSAFLDSDKATNTTSRAPSGVNRTTVAGTADTQGTGTFDGLVAYPTLWNAALSDADVASLAGGTYPTDIQSTSIVAHWPFPESDPGMDAIGNYRLAFTGSTFSSDAPSIGQPGGSLGTTYNDTLTESLTASDSIAAAATFAATVTEALTAAASPAPVVTFAASLAESLAASDSLSAAATFAAAVTAAVTAADSVTSGAASYSESVTEALTAADSLSASATFDATRGEALAASDALSALATFAGAVAEAATLADALQAAATYVNARAESLTAADALSASNAISLSRSESLTAADSLSATATFDATTLEDIAADDAVDAVIDFNADVEETLATGDDYAESVGILSPGIGLAWRVQASRLHWSVEGRPHWKAGADRLHWSMPE